MLPSWHLWVWTRSHSPCDGGRRCGDVASPGLAPRGGDGTGTDVAGAGAGSPHWSGSGSRRPRSSQSWSPGAPSLQSCSQWSGQQLLCVSYDIWMVNINMSCFPCICIAVQSRKARCKCNNYYSHDTYALCIALRHWNRSIGLSTKTGCERRTPDLFTLV